MYNPEIISAIANADTVVNSTLAFNKVGGELVFCVQNVKPEELSPSPHLVYVEDEFNQTTQEIVGTYPDYKIVNIADLPPFIYEKGLDNMMATKITKLYPIAEQVNILGRAITKLAKEHGIVLDELEELLDYIQLARETNREQKESYANDPNFRYVSNADIDARNEKLFAGGLHEALGAREVEGGRVFS